MYMNFLSVCMSVKHMLVVPKRPEGGVRFSGIRITGNCELPNLLGTKLRSSGKTASALLNC